MKRFLPLLLLVLLVSFDATSAPKPITSPPIPKSPNKPVKSVRIVKGAETLMMLAKPAVRAKALVTLPPPQTNVLMFAFPPNAADYLWDLMTSTNLVDWAIYMAPTVKPNGEPGLVACYNLKWPAVGLMEVPKRLPNEFFRMRGHKGPIGPFLPPSDPFPKLPFVTPWNPMEDPPGPQ